MNARTERERDYIDALLVMYAGYDKLGHRQRIVAFRDALEKLAAKYADDDEAQIAYAITLNTRLGPRACSGHGAAAAGSPPFREAL